MTSYFLLLFLISLCHSVHIESSAMTLSVSSSLQSHGPAASSPFASNLYLHNADDANEMQRFSGFYTHSTVRQLNWDWPSFQNGSIIESDDGRSTLSEDQIKTTLSGNLSDWGLRSSWCHQGYAVLDGPCLLEFRSSDDNAVWFIGLWEHFWTINHLSFQCY